MDFFTRDIAAVEIGESIGAEVETSFLNKHDQPIDLEQSQAIFTGLITQGWKLVTRRQGLVTAVEHKQNRVQYELGRQNIELATIPLPSSRIVSHTRAVLEALYGAAKKVGAFPTCNPILETPDNLLIIPDQRDQTWLEIDGKEALEGLARICAVQFTIAIRPVEAIRCLNRLAKNIGYFLQDYPQDRVWREYIHNSLAGYSPLRYGGPLFFTDLEEYCSELLKHAYVEGPKLVSCGSALYFDIPLFLRSIWWYFRLKRYGNSLCIEVRPIARRSDRKLEEQLKMVLDIIA